MDEAQLPLITNDAVVAGMLFTILAAIFFTSNLTSLFWKRFYKVAPSVLLCYFLPALLNTAGVISGQKSQLYPVASKYLLPASLVLLTIGVDISSLKKLGGKAVLVFLAGSVGVIVGAPVVLFILGSFDKTILFYNGEEVWRGLATIAGSWIGGSANQAAMLEVFGASKPMFGQMIAVDVLISNIWMGLLLFATQHNNKINKWLRADNAELALLEKRLAHTDTQLKQQEFGTNEMVIVLGVAFGITGFSHFAADIIAQFFATHFPGAAKYSLTSNFFWVVVIATSFAIALSFTKAKKLKDYHAATIGGVFLYFLIATIGMNMDLKAILNNPKLFLIGSLWLTMHIAIMVLVARIIKAPFFYVAVGSQANIGGAASAPIVAAAFNRYLAPVGVLLAVLGYAVGTYGGYVCGLAMQWVSGLLK